MLAASTPSTSSSTRSSIITTTLDPRFDMAYRFGAVFLAEAYPAGAGRADLAIKLLEKGLRERPDKWEYMEDIGFVYYWYRPRLPAGGRLVRQGRRCAGRAQLAEAAGGHDAGAGRRSPVVASHVARRFSSRRRSTGCARPPSIACSSWTRSTRSTSSRPWLDAFTREPGRRPADWGPVVRAGRVPGVPVDPTGTPLRADAGGSRSAVTGLAAQPVARRAAAGIGPR